MIRHSTRWFATPLALALYVCASASAENDAALEAPRNLRAASVDEVQSELNAWLVTRGATPETQAEIAQLWTAPAAASTDGLELLAKSMALADDRVVPLRAATQSLDSAAPLPDVAWLAVEETPAFERNNLRLWYGRWLAQRELYDEAAALLTDLEPAQVVDPATLLVYQGVVHQRLLAKEPGLKAIETLLDRVDAPPKRYQELGKMLRADLEALEDESLEHIARRMENIERHLGLGRADQKVRDIEDGVIASLDKMIKELEDKQKQQGGSGAGKPSEGEGEGQGKQSGPANGIKPGGAPAEQSAPARGRGDGEVDPKDLGEGDGWGNLPPKAREEAMQQIGQDFPAHYRDVIEQYFRKLADEGREN
jgi:hypothetical protein